MDIKDINIGKCQDILSKTNGPYFPARDYFLTNVPLASQETVEVEWGPMGTARDCFEVAEFLRYFTWPTNANNSKVPKRYVASKPNEPAFIVEGEKFDGVWRQVAVKERKVERRPGEFQYFVGLALGKGWAEALDWSEGRITQAVVAISNDESVDAIANTTTDNPIVLLLVRLDNIAQTSVYAIAASITAQLVDPIIGGIPYAGTWNVLHADPSTGNDGAGAINVMLAKPRFTVNTRSGVNTNKDTYIGRVHDVPLPQVQAIATAWVSADGKERTAQIDYDKNGKTATVTLYKMTPLNQTTQTKIYTAAKTTTIDESTQAGAPATGTREAGKTLSNINSPTANLKYATKVVTEEAQDQTNLSQVDSLADHTLVTEHTALATGAGALVNLASPITATAGTVRSVVQDEGDGGKVKQRDTVSQPKAQTFQHSYTDVDGAKRVTVFSETPNATVAAHLSAINPATQRASLSGSKTPAGNENATVTEIPVVNNAWLTAWTAYGTEAYASAKFVTTKNKRVFAYVLYTTQHSTGVEFVNGTSGGANGTVASDHSIVKGYGGFITGLYEKGGGRFKAVRVEALTTDLTSGAAWD